MPDTLAGKNINKCPIDDKKVEEKGRFVEVLYIQSKFFLGRDAIPAVHLRPSGNARRDSMAKVKKWDKFAIPLYETLLLWSWAD